MTTGARWIQTHRGHAYDLDGDGPTPDSIFIEDVAFALAHLHRYNGHAGAYSVAQHSVLAARVARAMGLSAGIQRSALMHDAHEAYTGDVPSPIKRVLGETWRTFERRHEIAVRRRFAVPVALPSIVTTIDLRLLITERRDLLGGVETRPWGIDVEPFERSELAPIVRWDADESRRAFLSEADRVGPGGEER